MKKVAVLQSNYIPWKGYFDIINSADLFIFYDDVQFTKNDWRNRNKIKTQGGLKWITIPCGHQNFKLIYEVNFVNSDWQIKHWNLIKAHYSKAPYFNHYKKFFENIYLNQNWKNLSKLNQYLIKTISLEFLNIKTQFDDSRNYNIQGKGEDRLINLLKKANTTKYISGPSAKAYISNDRFLSEGIHLEWMNYNNYPQYSQLYPPFEHAVSIIDLLFNTGPNAENFFKFNYFS
mgnify:CR=1 FL=1|tara:strand:- start:1990 stop:2685 length:696 start_codon:yes stop_codon:yes gene_type:complete